MIVHGAGFGLGVVALVPAGETGLSAEKWSIGPAASAVFQKPWGLFSHFNQNLLTVAGDDGRPDVDISSLKPIVKAPLDQARSAGLSEMNFVYDWDGRGFTAQPLCCKIAELTKIGGKSVRLQLSYERNFYCSRTGPKDTIGLAAKLLSPKLEIQR